MHAKNYSFYYLIFIFIGFISCQTSSPQKSAPVFEVSFSPSLSDTAFDGRLLLMLSTNEEAEPRFQITDRASSQQVFGIDVEGMKPGEKISIDGSAFGYPLPSLADLPAGSYQVQALLHKYETFALKTGHTVKLPNDRGEGQQWNRAPGNLLNKPMTMTISSSGTYEVEMSEEIPPIEEAKDTKYIKHIKIQSKMLSEFWGRPMYLGAHVLLPEGFDEHPEARYPLAIMHGHFPSDFGGFSTSPPDPNLEPSYSSRFGIEGYNIIQQQSAYDFYKEWSGPNFPRVLAIEIQHANPYYDDSYAVNSENLGPYGDAITYELIPYIEEKFRGIGEGWARFVYGGSTGGWEALAVQVKYPDEYNTCYAACPDPIDFRAYCLVNLYEDENAYYEEGHFNRVERPGIRDSLGKVNATLRNMNLRELALGTKGRSGQQWDIWEAVYSPMGTDGYPQRIWDKETGKINKEVANYWKENHDLAYIMKRDWKTLGPKLKGKINIYCGDMDNYYLNNAVYLAEEFLENTSEPYYDGEVDYGDRAEHCWNGDHTRGNGLSRLRYHQMFIPKWTKWVQSNAPKGADLSSWRY
ncbi:MAG: alpha/beta hydrolase-fold protein [Bacteroidia bacterium]|nr:alpha/beta hydrolase-fold protein [Bacteroidia bacterium]